MAGQEFSDLQKSGLLREVERIVVKAHRDHAESHARAWSRPQAYRWLGYEDPDPVARLREGVEKLRKKGVKFDAEAVDKACREASKTGFLN